jgi:Fur family peroxide stress response transcriptional regulator
MRKTEAERAERRLERLRTAAAEAGVKMTHQRLEILKELAGTEEHPDAETVFRAVRRRMPTVSIDTVYRTLWKLQGLGLVTTLGPGRDRVRFDANVDQHHHYVCVDCGLVRDFESEELNAVRVPGAVRQFGSVVGAQVEVRGRCARCQASSKASRKPGPPGAARRSKP